MNKGDRQETFNSFRLATACATQAYWRFPSQPTYIHFAAHCLFKQIKMMDNSSNTSGNSSGNSSNNNSSSNVMSMLHLAQNRMIQALQIDIDKGDIWYELGNMCLFEGRTAKTSTHALESLKAAVHSFLMASKKGTLNTTLDAVTCNLANTITEIALIPEHQFDTSISYFDDAKLFYAKSLGINAENFNTMTALAQYFMRRALFLLEIDKDGRQSEIQKNFKIAATLYQTLAQRTGIRDYLDLFEAAQKEGGGLTALKFMGGCNSY